MRGTCQLAMRMCRCNKILILRNIVTHLVYDDTDEVGWGHDLGFAAKPMVKFQMSTTRTTVQQSSPSIARPKRWLLADI